MSADARRQVVALRPLMAGVLAICCLSIAGGAPPASAAPKPNFVLILADDLGWADLPRYGNRFNETPRLDRLAAEGVRFTQFYAGAVCSPTRAQLQAGRDQARFGITQHIPGHRRPFAKLIDPVVAPHLPLPVETFAERLRAAGYRTGYFGKWHLGGEGYGPAQQGWDTVVELQGHDVRPNLAEGVTARRAADFLADEAIAFLEANRDNPFVLQVSPYAVHIPLSTTPELRQKYEAKRPMRGYPSRPEYAALLEELDRSVGRIVDAIDRLGLADNTLLMFTSDNGGLEHQQNGTIVTSNKPLRGEKGSLYEGGIRVPAIMRWPGVIPRGVVSATPAGTIDVHATLLDLAGIAPPASEPLDGVSFAPVLRQPAAALARDALYWHLPHYHHSTPASAMRRGNWKLIEFFENGALELYNLRADPGEQRNLVAKEPRRAAELQTALAGWRAKIGARMPTPNPNYDPARAKQLGRRTTVSHLLVSTVPRMLEAQQVSGRGKVISSRLVNARTPIQLLLCFQLAVLCAAAPDTRPHASAAQKAAPPNILFAIADDWSFGHAGACGTTWVRTPAFDRVAREGVLFTRAYTPNAKCAPSRAILLTGRQSWQLEEAANHVPFFPLKFKTWPEALGEHGYVTGMTGKGWGPGVATDANGKPRQMTGQPFNHLRSKAPTAEIAENDYAANFEKFLSTVPQGRPWSFWYGAHEPHRRYEYASGVSKGGKKLSDIDRVPPYWPDNDVVRNDMLDYAYEVEHFDRHLGRILETLSRAGALDNTLVIVTSDHGMPFPRVKGQAYEFANHVPLAIMWRNGIKVSGRTVHEYLSFADLAPTLVDLAGLTWKDTGMQPAAGGSFVEMLRSPPQRVESMRDHVLVGKERHDVGRPHDWGYPIRGIIKDEVLYLRNYESARWPSGNPETGYLNCDGSPTKTLILELRRTGRDTLLWTLAFGARPAEELYDLKQDPFCLINLAKDVQYRPRLERLRQRMARELRAQGDPRMFGRGFLFDRYVYADEKTRNFYERFMRGEKPKAGWVNDSDFEVSPIK